MKKFIIFMACILLILVALLIIPSYSDYSERTYVQEGLYHSREIKEAVKKYYFQHKKWPENNNEAKVTPPTGKAVKSIQIITQGNILIIYNKKIKDNGELILAPYIEKQGNEEKIYWHCSTRDPNAIPEKYLPATCRKKII